MDVRDQYWRMRSRSTAHRTVVKKITSWLAADGMGTARVAAVLSEERRAWLTEQLAARKNRRAVVVTTAAGRQRRYSVAELSLGDYEVTVEGQDVDTFTMRTETPAFAVPSAGEDVRRAILRNFLVIVERWNSYGSADVDEWRVEWGRVGRYRRFATKREAVAFARQQRAGGMWK
ncbi:MAG: hypothetical protein NW217_12860 [Hyphomicrobiaceae bacterium]|nr:hypothetical protein [Hyphomicrobiaceae bacterium]